MGDKPYSSLLEILVVIGRGETGLPPLDVIISDRLQTGASSIFPLPFPPQILAAVSSNLAMFPLQSPLPDAAYPPQMRRLSDARPAQLTRSNEALRERLARRQKGFGYVNETGEFEAGLMRTLSRRYRKEDGPSRVVRSSQNKNAELPLSKETLTALPTLCFPDDNCSIHDDERSDHIHYLVLTDILGCRMYAACFTYYIKVTSNGSMLSSRVSNSVTTFYIPQCLVFISKHPYFTTMKDCLSRLAGRLKNDTEDWYKVVKEFTLQLSYTLVPPAGRVQLEFQLQDTVFTLPCSDSSQRCPVDFDLSVIFRCLDTQAVLLIFTLLLTQQRLLFLSSNYSLLTLVTQGFLHLLFPFVWTFVYVPLLPHSLLELLEAPGVFIMGCHSKHWNAVAEVEGIVTVNLDHNNFRVHDNVSILHLPKEVTASFKDSAKLLVHHLELWRLESPTCFTYEGHRSRELLEQQKSNKAISLMFLELMVNLFRDVLNHIEPETRFFHKVKFLENIEMSDVPFYEKVLQTEMFGSFLKDRLDRKLDAWTDLVASKPKPLNRLSQYTDFNGTKEPMRLSPLPTLRNSSSMMNLSTANKTNALLRKNQPSDTMTTMMKFRLPNFVYGLSHMYLETCFQEISNAITMHFSQAEARSTFIYLRGILSAARGSKMAALEDFCHLDSSTSRIFPTEYVTEILTGMTEEERQTLESSNLYKISSVLKEIMKKNVNQALNQPIVTELNKIQQQAIGFERFIQLLVVLQITNHIPSADRLFTALTQRSESKVVDPVTFEEFYKAWKENDLEVADVSKLLPSSSVPEKVLRVSAHTKTSSGVGNIILTDRRILFLPEGSERLTSVMLLTDIKLIDKTQQRTFFKQTQALRLVSRADSSRNFTMSLREDQTSWFLFLHEMRAGRMIHEELGDPNIAQLSAQNVLLVDAFIRSGESELCCHHEGFLSSASSLCYFLSMSVDTVLKLYGNTRERLLCRLEPSVATAKHITVEALLYTPPFEEDDARVVGRLWCGTSDGQIIIYNSDSWMIEHKPLAHAEKRISSLLSVEDGCVWSGSFDKKIYIISHHAQDVTLENVLTGHSDLIIDILLSEDKRLAYSAGLDGQIIVWNTRTRTKISQIHCEGVKILRKIKIHQEKLWCCCQEVIIVLTLDGKLERKVYVLDRDNIGPAEIDCFLFTPDNKIWVGLRREGRISILCGESLTEVNVIAINFDKGVSCMALANDQVWIGLKNDYVYVVDMTSRDKILFEKVHSDRVLSIHPACDSDFIVTSSGANDGRLAVWRWSQA